MRSHSRMCRHAVVGLTNQWTHHRIDYKRYEKEYNKYRAEVDRLYDVTEDDEEFLDESSSRRKKLRSGRILCELDYKFMLYRHWTLYESMFHSRY
jgi:cell division control protein 45